MKPIHISTNRSVPTMTYAIVCMRTISNWAEVMNTQSNHSSECMSALRFFFFSRIFIWTFHWQRLRLKWQIFDRFGSVADQYYRRLCPYFVFFFEKHFAWPFSAIEIVLCPFERCASDMRKLWMHNIIAFAEDANTARWEKKMKKIGYVRIGRKRERRINYIGFAYLLNVLNFCVCFFLLPSESLNCECDVNVEECEYKCARRDTRQVRKWKIDGTEKKRKSKHCYGYMLL